MQKNQRGNHTNHRSCSIGSYSFTMVYWCSLLAKPFKEYDSIYILCFLYLINSLWIRSCDVITQHSQGLKSWQMLEKSLGCSTLQLLFVSSIFCFVSAAVPSVGKCQLDNNTFLTFTCINSVECHLMIPQYAPCVSNFGAFPEKTIQWYLICSWCVQEF